MLSSEAERGKFPVYLRRMLADFVAKGVCGCQHVITITCMWMAGGSTLLNPQVKRKPHGIPGRAGDVCDGFPAYLACLTSPISLHFL